MAVIEQTKNLKFLRESQKGILLLEGSSRSSKTYSVLQFLCLKALEKRRKIKCWRYDAATCEESIITDLRNIISTNFNDCNIQENKALKKFKFLDTGSEIVFGGTNSPGKLHGPAQEITYFNEIMEHSQSAWDQLEMRTTELMIADWNPSLNHHFVFDSIMKRPEEEWDYIHSTYKDNPFLSPKQIRGIEKYNPDDPANVRSGTADPYMWAVYGLGKRGAKEGRIYRNWEIRPDKEFPLKRFCDRWAYGLDFGFSADPSALVLCAVYQDALWLHQMVYETDLIAGVSATNPIYPSIEKRMLDLKVNKNTKIWADGARPDLIHELYLGGFNVAPSKKGPGSVIAGINKLKTIKMYVTQSSMDIIRELEQYCWARKRDGTWLDDPEDANNHAMDAVRYFAMMEIKRQNERKNTGPYKAKGGRVSSPRKKKAGSIGRTFL